eukprot:s1435_g5.t1
MGDLTRFDAAGDRAGRGRLRDAEFVNSQNLADLSAFSTALSFSTSVCPKREEGGFEAEVESLKFCPGMPDIAPTDFEGLARLAEHWVRSPDRKPVLQLSVEERRARPDAAAAWALRTFNDTPYVESCRLCGTWTGSWCEGCYALAVDQPGSALCTVCDQAHLVCPRCSHHPATRHTRRSSRRRRRRRSRSRRPATDSGSPVRSGSPAPRPPLPRRREILPARPLAPLDPELTELLATRPAGMAAFLQDLGICTLADLKYMWDSGQALTAEFEAVAGRLPADSAFSVASLWTLAMSRTATTITANVNRLIAERESHVRARAPERNEPGEPPRVMTYRRLIATGGTPQTPTMAAAADASPYAREQATRQAKLDAFFQLLLEDVVDLNAMGATMQQLQDPGSLQSLKEMVLAVPSQLGTERLGALMASFRRWKKFAVAKQYPVKTPAALQVAEFLQQVSKGGPTAASAVWQGLNWFKDRMGVDFPMQHWLVTPYKYLPTNYVSTQALELEPWEFVNLVLYTKQQLGTNLILAAFVLQCAVSCIRFEHVQCSRPSTDSKVAAMFHCKQGKRRVRGTRPGYAWSTPEVQLQGFSLLKILVEFFKHECLSEVDFLWPQVQLSPDDL